MYFEIRQTRRHFLVDFCYRRLIDYWYTATTLVKCQSYNATADSRNDVHVRLIKLYKYCCHWNFIISTFYFYLSPRFKQDILRFSPHV